MKVNDKLVCSLLQELLRLAKTAPAYIQREQWALSAVITARYVIEEEIKS